MEVFRGGDFKAGVGGGVVVEGGEGGVIAVAEVAEVEGFGRGRGRGGEACVGEARRRRRGEALDIAAGITAAGGCTQD